MNSILSLRKDTSYLILFTSTLLISCSKNEDNDEKFTSFDNIIPINIRQELSKHMPIYTGNNPPNIEGNYYFDPLLIYSTVKDEYEDAYEEDSFDDEVLSFSDQTKSNTIILQESYIDDGVEEELVYDTPGSGYIFGEGDKFTT